MKQKGCGNTPGYKDKSKTVQEPWVPGIFHTIDCSKESYQHFFSSCKFKKTRWYS